MKNFFNRPQLNPCLVSRQCLQARWLIVSVLVVCLVSIQSMAHAASLTDIKATWIGWSSIKITESGFDFGGEKFLAGVPSGSGSIDRYLKDGQLAPSLNGHLHLNDVREFCARMRMDYYAGAILLTTKYGGQVCAPDDKHHEWDVSVAHYTNRKIDKVQVSIEKLTATKDWTNVGSNTLKLKAVQDKFKITEGGFDFGGKACAPDNRHHTWSVDLEPYSDNKLAYIKIGLQTLGADNTWRPIGTVFSRYVSAPVAICSGSGSCLHVARNEIK